MAGAVVINLNHPCFCGAPTDAAKLFVASLETPMMQFRINTESYPETGEGLTVLKAPTARIVSKWKGPYIKPDKELLDPWKQPYRYRCPGLHNPNSYDVWSIGPDGKSGTDDDIGNWKNN